MNPRTAGDVVATHLSLSNLVTLERVKVQKTEYPMFLAIIQHHYLVGHETDNKPFEPQVFLPSSSINIVHRLGLAPTTHKGIY